MLVWDVFLKILTCMALIVTLFFPVKVKAHYCSLRKLEQVLKFSGENKVNLEDFISSYSDAQKREAACFLVSSLPLSDTLTITKAELSENLEYAFLAKKTMPWGKKISWEDFLLYVLPHRIAQEPHKKWRKFFFENIAPKVKKLPIKEAISFIANWCAQKVTFKPSAPWDLDPISLIKLGWGRCEEQSILLIAALRSVAIPARLAFVPAWQHTNGNHGWVEVWTYDNKWHVLDPSTPNSSLDNPWFRPFYRTMPVVLVNVYGKEKYLNNIKLYNPNTTKLVISLKDKKNHPVKYKTIYISVYNHASLRVILWVKTDKTGIAHAILGYGTYFISSQDGDKYAAKLIYCFNKIKKVKLILSSKFPFRKRTTLIFKYPLPDKINKKYHQFLINLHKKKNKYLLQIPKTTNPVIKTWITKYMHQMKEKDIIECTFKDIYNDVLIALNMRKKRTLQGIIYDDDTFLKYVLNPRIYIEPWSCWRSKIKDLLKDSLENLSPEELIQSIIMYFKGVKKIKQKDFGPMLTPMIVLKNRIVKSNIEGLIAIIATLRSFGIAARYSVSSNCVEVNLGHGWQRLHTPFDQFNDRLISFKINWKKIYGKCPAKPLHYKQNYTLARWKNGHFCILKDPIIKKDNSHCILKITNIPQGQYFVIKGKRINSETSKVIISSLWH